MASEGDAKIRRIAIVLQSMDADTVRNLLAQFPDDAARAIRRALANLGTVSPAERAAAAKDLKNLFGKTSDPSAVDNPALQVLDQGKAIEDAVQWSSEVRSAGNSENSSQLPLQDGVSSQSGKRWLNIPPATLAQVLQHERPTVVAAIVHELPVVMATAVLQLLPIPIATQTMAAMPHLHRNDSSILHELMDQVRVKVEELARSEQKSQLGLEKLKAIVAHAPENQRYLWATSLGSLDPQLPSALGWNRGTSNVDTPIILPFPTPSSPRPIAAPQPEHEKASEPLDSDQQMQLTRFYRSIRDLMQLDDADFVAVLHSVDPKSILLALAGADSIVLKRVERLLPKKDLPRFRERIHELSDVSLKKIDEASTAILEVANHMYTEGRIAKRSAPPFSAAA